VKQQQAWTSIVVVALGLALVSGCAAMRREEARDKENLLAAAGFQIRPADTPEKIAKMNAMPANQMIVRNKDDHVVYTYADPLNCKCLYVGTPQNYSDYRRLALQREIAQDQLDAAVEEDNAAMDWGMWGPWWW
jgi:hypothetical protein